MSKLRVDTLETLDGTKTVNVADIGTGGGGGGSVTVEDLLTSTSAVNALSANQGNVLKTLVDTKVDKVTGKGLSTEDYTTVEKGKLASIEAAATANSSDSTLLNRANHTGAQAISTVTGLQAALDAKAPTASPTFTGTVSGITKAMVGLGNVDNTSDANKPVSTAQQAALDGKEPSLAAGGTTAQYLRGDKAWTDFSTSVRAALLTGFASGPNSAVAATDSVLQAIQKLQAQISAGGGGGGATIKAIQRGTITIANGTASATATITAVDVTKTELRFLGGSGVNSTPTTYMPRVALTNSTTITATMGSNSSSTTTISWELTEWN